MDVVYRLQNLEFEWDSNKAQINLGKHGVTFTEAAEVFFDPFYQTGDATDKDENREFILGYSLTYRLLLVVFVERGKRLWLISARSATRQEKNIYENS